ncbi:hypothetical protein [Lysinibacillus fusiformis]|uniref:hypothetical protein n=1 Tax=Lysinibacillus fusiformis TaxID=28031 RepID=UPI00046866B5|nr:hypothetical protein [Lysinibacillus fusiformis]
MYDFFEKLLDLCRFTGYSILAIWLFSYIKMNSLTEGKNINEHIQGFYDFLDKNILEFTLAVAILEVISALNNVFIKPFFTESSLKQDLKIIELEYKIERLENALRSRQDK